MNKSIIIGVISIAAVIGVVVILITQNPNVSLSEQANQPQPVENAIPALPSVKPAVPPVVASIPNNKLSMPVGDALSRVTKKPFGLYVTPKDSPISPEKFIGYHTGVDFETTPEEQDIDVPVYAICAGPLILKKTATGYGGVAIQSCEINKEAVTVVYGHLRLSSITASQNTSLSQGQQIGVLGKGYSTETAGERKHLHLGIHKGSSVVLLGYVQNKSELNQWIDFLTLVK